MIEFWRPLAPLELIAYAQPEGRSVELSGWAAASLQVGIPSLRVCNETNALDGPLNKGDLRQWERKSSLVLSVTFSLDSVKNIPFVDCPEGVYPAKMAVVDFLDLKHSA